MKKLVSILLICAVAGFAFAAAPAKKAAKAKAPAKTKAEFMTEPCTLTGWTVF